MSDKSDNLSEISRKFVCKICNKYYASNSSLWNHNKKFHPLNSTILPQNSTILPQNTTNLPQKITFKPIQNIHCNYCNKIFSRNDSLKRHLKICKFKIEHQDNQLSIIEENKLLKEQLNNILKSNKMHPKTFQKINNQLINNNTTNNTINNNNINITYIKFGDEKLSEILTDSEMMKILFDCRLGITKSVELTHFNDKRPSLLLNINSLENLYLPELKNIIITNLQNNIGYVFNGEKFEAKPKEYILGDLFDKHLDNIDGECIAFAINR